MAKKTSTVKKTDFYTISKSTVRVLLIVLALALIIGAIILSTNFISKKVDELGEDIVKVDEESIERDLILADGILENRARIDGLESDLGKAKKDIANLKAKANKLEKDLKSQQSQPITTLDPAPVADNSKKTSNKKNKGKGFNFDDLERIGEELEEAFSN